jgi:hypothetical protein
MRAVVYWVFFCGLTVGLVIASLHERRWGSAAFELGVAALCGFNAWTRYRKLK